MIRWVQIASVLAAMIAAVAVFQIKYRAEGVAEEAARLQRSLDQETETVSLLKAEWSLLNQPSRVQDVVTRHGDALKLQPLDPMQIARIDQLPMRPTGPEAVDETALSDLLGEDAAKLSAQSQADAAALDAILRGPSGAGERAGQ